VRSLYVRIWLTVVAALALFGAVSGWLLREHLESERARIESSVQTRAEAWADLLQRSLPPADAPGEEQAAGLRDWSQRLRLPMALDDASGNRIGASESFLRREAEAGGAPRRAMQLALADGRRLWIARPPRRVPGDEPRAEGGAGGPPDGMVDRDRPERAARTRLRPGFMTTIPGLPEGTGIVVLLALLFLAVAGGAYPFVRRLTRRLESLKQGVETFGGGALHHRVDEGGRDEVAAVAASFNQAAARIEALLRSNQSLLANASHELRSPLARLKMAVSMLDDAAPAQREKLRAEIHTNIAELDALVEEVLLASRLDAAREELVREPVNLLVLAAEEAARVQGSAQGTAVVVAGDERLLRRALRNLLENARRYGGDEVTVFVARAYDGGAEVRVCDRGPGVPPELRERIFEAFFRLPGHAEREGGIGLGLALVRQIAQRHGGSVRCEPHEGGGSCFILALPPK
jgi:signal transduction histidine kinase